MYDSYFHSSFHLTFISLDIRKQNAHEDGNHTLIKKSDEDSLPLSKRYVHIKYLISLQVAIFLN